MSTRLGRWSLVLMSLMLGRAVLAEPPPLIPREVLFGNPDKAGVRISPDGARLSYLAPVGGVLNLWIAPLDNLAAAKAITQDEGRGIQQYFWAYTNKHILFLQDKDGDENWRIYCVDIESGTTKDLTPAKGVRAEVISVSYKFPTEVVIGLNDREPQLHDLYRLNILTGERQLILQNDGFVQPLVDDDYNVRFITRMTPDGGSELFQRMEGQQPKSFARISQADSLTTSPLHLDKNGQVLYMLDCRDRNTSALVAVDLQTQKTTVLAEDARADAGSVLAHPTERTIEAVAFEVERTEWKVLDKNVEEDFAYLRKAAEGDIDVVSRTLDEKHWIVAYHVDAGPLKYYHYDRPARKAALLCSNRQALEGLQLAAMHPVTITSRDGLDLISYLTLPPASDTDRDGHPDSPQAMVLLVHGGPWGRDEWGYNAYHQWLANRGYAVLAVNFRGSTGFGKKFTNAGDKQWGAKMHEDLVDAVLWAAKQRIAAPDKVAIMGGSYGGYATLVGLTHTPNLFACGVDVVGPSNLITLLESIPPYWKPALDMFSTRIGDPRTPEGRQLLQARSPLTHVDQIRRPLLIGQGANDPRVKQAEADQIVKAMQDKNIPVTYVLFPDEGHGFARPENTMAFNAIAEAFFAQNLGGRYEPIGKSFRNSSVTVPTGAEQVPGLSEALKSK